MLFIFIKENKEIKGLYIFGSEYLYSIYADDTTFFLKDLSSIRELLKVINSYSAYSGLKPNISKCDAAGISVLKGVKVTICGFHCINLKTKAIKILGIYFSYDKNIQFENNFNKIITNITSVLKMWRLRNLTLEGKIIIFKSLALSKLVYTAQVMQVSDSIIDKIKQIQKDFLWSSEKPKVKHETICNAFRNGGLKNMDVNDKIKRLKCSWIRRLYDDKFHEWKLIPQYLIKNVFGLNFIFHSNLSFDLKLIYRFPSFYQVLFKNWIEIFSYTSDSPSCIRSQFSWFNKQLRIDNKSFIFKELSHKKSKLFKSIA